MSKVKKITANWIEDGTTVWRCNTPALLKEILNNNPTMWMLAVPMKILGDMLFELGTVASRINDPELNAMMCRLAIYEEADPYSATYDSELVENTIKKAYKIKKARKN